MCVFASSDSGCYPKVPRSGLDRLVDPAKSIKAVLYDKRTKFHNKKTQAGESLELNYN